MFASTFIAPIVGTYLGFNYTKSQNKYVTERGAEKIMESLLLIGATISFFVTSGILK